MMQSFKIIKLMNQIYSIRYKSSPNIALVKYWGKYHEEQILPINDSIGLTLNSDDLTTYTTCSFANHIDRDQFCLNAKQTIITNRMAKILQKFRQKVRQTLPFISMDEAQWKKYNFKIQSVNSFPTASGMASSASGFSCLATALNGLFGNILSEAELSRLARWGSGSAARAVYGGLVKWIGVKEEVVNEQIKLDSAQLQQLSRQCISFSIKPYNELSYIKVVILLTDAAEKDVSSTIGMKLSMQTSELIHCRNRIARQRIQTIESILSKIDEARRDKVKNIQYQLYSRLAEEVIRDSNQFHAICLDTYPPIFYLNEFSRQIIYIVDNILNKETKKTKVAYSFDAGAHAFLFVHEDMLHEVLLYLQTVFELNPADYNQKGRLVVEKIDKNQPSLDRHYSNLKRQAIRPKGVWVTDVGRGAQKM